jgi:hypothetical protein
MVLGTGVLDLPELCGALDEFIAGDNEGGKIGQAFVPAILDLVFDDVRTKAINDPSSKWPGDVGVFADGAQILAIEVKQRAFSEAEVLLFAQRLHEIGLHRGFIAAFDQASVPLEQEQLHFQAHRLYGVELSFFLTPSALLVEACRFAPRDIPPSLSAFPAYAVKRMEELEVSAKRLSEWTSLFTNPASTS